MVSQWFSLTKVCCASVLACVAATVSVAADPPEKPREAKSAPAEKQDDLITVYRVRHIEPGRVFEFANVLGLVNLRDARSGVRIVIDEERDRLIAYGSPQQHERLRKALELLDVAVESDQGDPDNLEHESVSLRLLCLIENGDNDLPKLEGALAEQLKGFGFGEVARVTELVACTALGGSVRSGSFGVSGNIEIGILQAEFQVMTHDDSRNSVIGLEVELVERYGDETEILFRTQGMTRMPWQSWAVVAASPLPDSDIQSRLILLLRADPTPMLESE